ncbi:hypothetical protein D3C81_997620 [compost metagenome]
MQQHRLAAEGDGHVLVEHAIGNGGGDLLADNRFDGALVGDHDGAVLLKDLATTDVIGMAVGVDHVFHRYVEALADLVTQPTGGAGRRRINDQRAFLGDQHQTTVHRQSGSSCMAVEVAFHLFQPARHVRAGRAGEVRQHGAIGVLGLVDRDAVVGGVSLQGKRECGCKQQRQREDVPCHDKLPSGNHETAVHGESWTRSDGMSARERRPQFVVALDLGAGRASAATARIPP